MRVTSAMRLLRTANARGYESSVASPIAMYAATLRLQKSAMGPLASTPRKFRPWQLSGSRQ